MSRRSCLSVTNDPYINKLAKQLGVDPIVAHSKIGNWMDQNNSDNYPTIELFLEYLNSQNAESIQHDLEYNGDLKRRVKTQSENVVVDNVAGRKPAVEGKVNLTKKNLFTVKPIRDVDKKAAIKASIATQYIGFGEGIPNSSTELYRQQILEQNENISKISVPLKDTKKIKYTLFNKILNRNITKSGYRITIPEFPDVELYLTNEDPTSESKEGTTEFNMLSKKWNVEVNTSDKGAMLISTPFSKTQKEVLELFAKDINDKHSKSDSGNKILKSIGINLSNESLNNIVNSGIYTSNDVIFVSVVGKRGDEKVRKEQQDKTIREAIKAIEAGATLITDNKSYIDSSNYNEGEKRLAKNFEAKGYNYAEQTVDGQILGVWTKSSSLFSELQDNKALLRQSEFSKDFTATEKEELAIAIADIFSSVISKHISKKAAEGFNFNRIEAIEDITPYGAFSRIIQILELLKDNPGAARLSQDHVKMIKKALPHFWNIADMSARYIARNEGFFYRIDSNKVEDLSIIESTNPESNQSQEAELNLIEVKEESLKEGWSIKHQHLSPKNSLSSAVRKLLNTIPSIDVNGNIQRNIIGSIKYLNSDLAHAILIDKLKNMTKASDMDKALEDLSRTRAWIAPLIDRLNENPSLKSQFYRDMRKDFVTMMVVKKIKNKDGSYSMQVFPINKPRGMDYLLDEWSDNYSSGTTLSENSIYDSTNRVVDANVQENIEKINDLRHLFKRILDKNDFDQVAEWVNENIDDISDILKSIGISEDIEILRSALNNNPFSNPEIKYTHPVTGILKLLMTMFTTILNNKIGYDPDGNKHPVDWRKEFKGLYDRVAKLLAPMTEDGIESSVFENGASYYSHQVPNYLNKYIKNFKHSSPEDLQIFLEREFGRYHQFYDFEKGLYKDGWVKDLAEEESSRNLLDAHNMINFNKVDYPNLSELEYTQALILQFFGAPQKGSAYYHFPILSDSPVGVFLKFKRYDSGKNGNIPVIPGQPQKSYKDFLLDKFFKLSLQEYDRIKLVRLRRELSKQDDSIQLIENFDSERGTQFLFFPKLNSIISQFDTAASSNDVVQFERLQSEAKDIIEESLNEEFDKAYLTWLSAGLFKTDDKGVFLNLDIGARNLDRANALLENYFWNSAYATSQMIMMTTGDLAFYKNIENFLKRNKQNYAPANRLNTESKYGKEIQRTAILKDVQLTSNSYLLILEAMRSAGVPLDQIREAMGVYVKSENTLGINLTDAQAYGSLQSYRAIEDMLGNWIPERQLLYDKLIAHSLGLGPKFTAQDFSKLVQFQTLKPFAYTLKAVDSRMVDEYGNPIYIKTPMQHKNSWHLITIAGLMSKSPLMVALNNFMSNHNIDMIQFESAVKVGKQGVIDISGLDNADLILEVLESNMGLNLTNPSRNPDLKDYKPSETVQSQHIHDIPYEDFGIQQPLEDHITDYYQLFGTLIRKLITGDLPNSESYRITVNGKDLTKNEWLKEYNSILVENILDSFMQVRELFSSNELLELALLEAVRSNTTYTRDVEAAVTLNLDREFPLPLYEPAQSVLIQQLLTSIIKSRITNQKIKGGSLVLVSNFGFTDDLNLRFKDINGLLIPTLKDWLRSNPGKSNKDYRKFISENQHSLAYYEVYMPAYSKEFFEDFMDPNTGEIDANKLPDNLRKAIGYRIPTEHKYSMIPMYIKGFLPSYAGSLIMLPAEITSITGSDFDVDKMYVMLPEFTRTTVDRNKARLDYYADQEKKFLEGSIELEESRSVDDGLQDYINENIERYTLQRPRYSKVKYNTNKGASGNNLAARNNLLIDMMWGVLTSKGIAGLMFNPQGFDILKKAARIVTLLQNVSKKDLEKSLGGKIEVELPKATLLLLEDLSDAYKSFPNILNPSTQVLFHQLNMIAAKMIGIAANHNANHALMLLTRIGLSEDMTFYLDGKLYSSLSLMYNADRELISRNVSGYLAASVDAVSDPVLNFINVNTFTADPIFMLARLGHSPLTISLLMTLPSVLALTNHFFNNKSSGISKASLINDFISEFEKINELESIEDLADLDISQSELMEGILNPKDVILQLKALYKFALVISASYSISSLTAATRADTSGGGAGPDIANTEIKINKLVDYIEDNGILTDNPLLVNGDILRTNIDLRQGELSKLEYKDRLRQELNGSELPMSQAFLTLGLESMEVLMGGMFPHFRNDFRYIMNTLRNYTNTQSLRPDTMNKIYSDIFAYILSSSEYFTGGSLNNYIDRFEYYTKDFVNEFRAIKLDPQYKDNLLIKSLQVSSAGNNRPIDSIRFQNVGSLSATLKAQIQDAWTELLYMNDSSFKLANDLFIYNYFKNGFAFGPESFIHLAPVLFKLNVPGYISGLNRIMEAEDSEASQNKYEQFIELLLLNRTNIRELVPQINEETSFYFTNHDGTVKESISFIAAIQDGKRIKGEKRGNRQFYVGQDSNDNMIYRPVVTTIIDGREYVYRLQGIQQRDVDGSLLDLVYYERTKKLGYPNQYLQYLYGVKASDLTNSLTEIAPSQDTDYVENSYDVVPAPLEYEGVPYRPVTKNVKAPEQLKSTKQEAVKAAWIRLLNDGYVDPEDTTLPDKRTRLESINEARYEFNKKLNNKIRVILELNGVSIGALSTLEEKLGIAGIFDGTMAEETSNGLMELIRIANGERGERALPEEFAHFAFEALGNDPLADRLINLISLGDFIQEILGNEYKVYDEKYGGDLILMAKEAIGKLLAKHMLKNEAIPKTGWRSLLNRVILKIKDLFSKLPFNLLMRAKLELNNEFAKVAEGLLEGSYSEILNIQNIKNSSYSTLLYSLDERASRDRLILKDMVEAETKLYAVMDRDTSLNKDRFRQKELIEKLNKRLERGKHLEELLGISEYLDGALKSLKDIDELMMKLYNSDNVTINVAESASLLRDANYTFTAYNSVLLSVKEQLVNDLLRGETRFDDKIIAQINEALEISQKMELAYREMSLNLFSKFLEPFLGPNIKEIYKGKTGLNIDILSMLERKNNDISFFSRWLDSMSRINDLPSLMIDAAVKKQKNLSRNETIEVSKRIKEALLKLESAGHKNTDFMYDLDENGVPNGKYTADYDAAKFHTAKHNKRNELKEKYKDDESGLSGLRMGLELDSWEHSLMSEINGLMVPKKSLYPSESFAKLTDAQKEYYNTFMEIKTSLEDKLPPNMQNPLRTVMMRKDLLERMRTSNNIKGASEHFVDALKDLFIRRADDTDFGDAKYRESLMDFAGNEVLTLPVYYIKELENMSSLSLDSASTLIAYAYMVNDYANMNKIIDALEIGRDIIRNRDVDQSSGGIPKKEVVKHMGRTIESTLKKKGDATNVVQRLDDYYSMLIYGRYMKDLGDIRGTKIQVSKLANFINQATSISVMGFNMFIGTTNALTGNSLMFIESVANENFDVKDIARADRWYFGALAEHLGLLGKRVKTSKLHLLDEMFNANQNSEQVYQHSNLDRRNILSKLFSMETIYFMSTAGEHWMHLRTLLSVLSREKVLDPSGKETRLYDALERVYRDPSNPSRGADLKIKEGYKKLDGSEISKDYISDITNKVATINQDMHGVYNKIDRDAFQALAQGRMIEMFRKWMVRSIRRRYQKGQYVVELDREVEGFYRTMGRFTKLLGMDLIRGQFLIATLRFKLLSKHEQANILRAIADVGQALVISSLLAWIDWGGDDEDSWWKNALQYQLYRQRTELMSVIPLPQGILEEGKRILQSPMAGMRLIGDIGDLLQFWNWFDEVSYGRYEGQQLWWKSLQELIPFNKTIYGVFNPEERLYFYKKDM